MEEPNNKALKPAVGVLDEDGKVPAFPAVRNTSTSVSGSSTGDEEGSASDDGGGGGRTSTTTSSPPSSSGAKKKSKKKNNNNNNRGPLVCTYKDYSQVPPTPEEPVTNDNVEGGALASIKKTVATKEVRTLYILLVSDFRPFLHNFSCNAR